MSRKGLAYGIKAISNRQKGIRVLKKSTGRSIFWYTITNMDLRATYDRIAEDWHGDHRDDDWWIGGADAFTPLIKPGGLVLDVGCGGGRKSRYLI